MAWVEYRVLWQCCQSLQALHHLCIAPSREVSPAVPVWEQRVAAEEDVVLLVEQADAAWGVAWRVQHFEGRVPQIECLPFIQ